MAILKMREKFDLKILEKVGSQTLTNGDYTKQQLNVIIDLLNSRVLRLLYLDCFYYSLEFLRILEFSGKFQRILEFSKF